MSDDRVETHVVIEDEAGRRADPLPGVVGAAARRGPRAASSCRSGVEDAKPGAGRPRGHRRRRRRAAAAVQPGRVDRHDPRRARHQGRARGDRGTGGRGLADHRRRAGARHGRRLPDRDRASRPRRPRSAGHYTGLLDGWLVADTDDASVPTSGRRRRACVARPLLMSDLPATRAIARAAFDLAARAARGRVSAVHGPRRRRAARGRRGRRPGRAASRRTCPTCADGDDRRGHEQDREQGRGPRRSRRRPRGRDRRRDRAGRRRARRHPDRRDPARAGARRGRRRRAPTPRRAPCCCCPIDPDASARRLRAGLRERLGVDGRRRRHRHGRAALAARPDRPRDRRRRPRARSTTTAGGSTPTAASSP